MEIKLILEEQYTFINFIKGKLQTAYLNKILQSKMEEQYKQKTCNY